MNELEDAIDFYAIFAFDGWPCWSVLRRLLEGTCSGLAVYASDDNENNGIRVA